MPARVSAVSQGSQDGEGMKEWMSYGLASILAIVIVLGLAYVGVLKQSQPQVNESVGNLFNGSFSLSDLEQARAMCCGLYYMVYNVSDLEFYITIDGMDEIVYGSPATEECGKQVRDCIYFYFSPEVLP